MGEGVSSLAQTALPLSQAGEEAGLLGGGGPPEERSGTSQEFGLHLADTLLPGAVPVPFLWASLLT